MTRHVDPINDLGAEMAKIMRRLDDMERRAHRHDLEWRDLNLTSGNWTLNQQPRWVRDGNRVWLGGYITRTTSSFGGGGNLIALGDGTGSQPPTPKTSKAQWINCVVWDSSAGGLYAELFAVHEDATYGWVVQLQNTYGRQIDVGDKLFLGDWSYSLS